MYEKVILLLGKQTSVITYLLNPSFSRRMDWGNSRRETLVLFGELVSFHLFMQATDSNGQKSSENSCWKNFYFTVAGFLTEQISCSCDCG